MYEHIHKHTIHTYIHIYIQERKVPVVPGEGPFGLCINPSRELARQTYDVVMEHCEALAAGGFARLKVLCKSYMYVCMYVCMYVSYA